MQQELVQVPRSLAFYESAGALQRGLRNAVAIQCKSLLYFVICSILEASFLDLVVEGQRSLSSCPASEIFSPSGD